MQTIIGDPPEDKLYFLSTFDLCLKTMELDPPFIFSPLYSIPSGVITIVFLSPFDSFFDIFSSVKGLINDRGADVVPNAVTVEDIVFSKDVLADVVGVAAVTVVDVAMVLSAFTLITGAGIVK